ncbi:hypothetical protein D3D01_22320 [Haloarcula sp. Atlit-7R]|nr:hypothetical protein D3D01_22320 [Haloarcula sp. Atlit-7R]
MQKDTQAYPLFLGVDGDGVKQWIANQQARNTAHGWGANSQYAFCPSQLDCTPETTAQSESSLTVDSTVWTVFVDDALIQPLTIGASHRVAQHYQDDEQPI